MSWVRSLQLAHSMLKNGTYSNVLIVNAEFTVHEHGIPDALKVCTDEALKYTFPALTIGEAATATVVSASERPWAFRFRSRPEFASLCTLPLPGYQDFCDLDPSIGLNGPLRLVSFGSDLSRAALREMLEFSTRHIRSRTRSTYGSRIRPPNRASCRLRGRLALARRSTPRRFASSAT